MPKVDLEQQTDKNYLTQKRWLTTRELETEYGFSRSWQSKARMISNDSLIPFSKLGKSIRYDRYEIDRWLEDHQVQGVA